MERSIAEHIEITPGICGGKPRIAGTRIRVQDIVVWHDLRGMTADEIISTVYPQLSLADVHAALAYYHDHTDEIRGDMRAEEELVRQMRTQNPSILVRKLTGQDADSTSVSS